MIVHHKTSKYMLGFQYYEVRLENDVVWVEYRARSFSTISCYKICEMRGENGKR